MDENQTQHSPSILIVSGGVGASAEQLVYTVLAQFPEQSVRVSKLVLVRDPAQVTQAVQQARESGSLVIHTLVDKTLRQQLEQEGQQAGVQVVDLMGPTIDWIAGALGQPPLGQPGLYRQLHHDYFERVAAIDYTMMHDDGKRIDGWPQADAVLVGVSRTGKTPLSIYLAVLGWKIANYPLVPQIPVPEALFSLNPEQVIGLKIDPAQLLVYRRQRQSRLGVVGGSTYEDPEAVQDEVRESLRVFRRGGFVILDMTDKTIEQAADEIIRRLVQKRSESAL